MTTALLIMIKLEKKNFSWENAKKMMAKVDAFKEQLEEYRGEDVPEVSRTSGCWTTPYREPRCGLKEARSASGLDVLIDACCRKGSDALVYGPDPLFKPL